MSITTVYEEDLVKEVTADFQNRREMRRNIESKWLLNINFMLGNQYSGISPGGDIVDYGKQYYWQEREVFNHIAPLIETRLAKFARVNCSVNVRPATAEENDVRIAKLSTKLIEATQRENNFIRLSNEANYWAELTGTVFYKVVWGGDSEGVRLAVCPPYEIYPDTLGASGLQECRSLIHARAYPVETIREIWGKEVKGGSVSVINMDTSEGIGGNGYTASNFKVFSDEKKGYAVVIERYELPTERYPEGRLVIVAGDSLLYEGSLPYVNGGGGTRTFPFVRQASLEQPASFYGISIIERLIPVQRAYNAVKNRKHEFLNRLAAGVMMVEDGSIDVDSLEEEGLSPGKLLVYRRGATPPGLMNAGSVPTEFRDEEDRLLAEFINISGASNLNDVMVSSSGQLSGYALSLIIEQDYSRLNVTTENIRNAVREMAAQILRLYRQFSPSTRMMRVSGENGELEVVSFEGSQLTSDDIVTEADAEMVETPATRKTMVFDLLKYGLLNDATGSISEYNKVKVLEMLGFGNWESARSRDELHLKKAAIENAEMAEGKDPGIEEFDDHDLHVGEHIATLIAGRDSLSEEAKTQLNRHIKQHKVYKRLTAEAEAVGTGVPRQI